MLCAGKWQYILHKKTYKDICRMFYLIITKIEYYAKYFVKYLYFCYYLFKYLTSILYLCRNYHLKPYSRFQNYCKYLYWNL